MKKRTDYSRGPKIPGIVNDAATLGVSRHHLHAVLTARRISRSLTRRYRALQAAKRAVA